MTHLTAPNTAGGRRKRRWRRIGVRVTIGAAVTAAGIAGAALWAVRVLPGMTAAEISRLVDAHVETGAFDFHLDGSVSIDGLLVRPRRQEPLHDNTILRARSVRARFARGSLLRLSPRVTEIHVEDFMLDAQLNLDTGRWNVGSLRIHLPKGEGGRTMPSLDLQRGRLRYCKISGPDAEVVMSVPIEARFGSRGDVEQGYGFEVKTSKLSGGHGASYLRGSWRPGELVVAGGLSSTDIPSLERAWAVDVLAAELTYDANRDYALDLRMKDAHGKQAPEVDTLRFIVPAMADSSGPLATLQRFFARYRPTGMVGSIHVKARGNLDRLLESEVTGRLVCRDVSICDSRFPYRIDHLAGALDFTEATMQANQLSGRHGAVDLRLEGWTRGYGDQRQYQYRVTSANMVLDESLYAALQPDQKRLWDAFQPRGMIAADYRLARNSPTDKRLSVSVELNGVTAAYREFPYPLTELTGRLYFDRESIIVSDIVSGTGGRQISFNGKVTERDTDHPVYYITIDANDIPMDATLGEALPPRYRELYQRFDANGVARMRATVFSTPEAPHAGPVSFRAEVFCDQASVKPAHLPFVLSDVTAEAAITPESLGIRKFRGRYNDRPVTVAGGMQFAKDDALRQCHLRITAERMPLNDETISLLPPSLAQQAAAFRPQGDVNVTAEIRKADGKEQPDYTIALECLGNKVNHKRIEYPLEDVRGTVSIASNGVTLQGVTARPAGLSEPQSAAGVQIDAAVRLMNGGFEKGSFTITARDMPFTSELARALPKRFAQTYRDLAPQGRFDLDATTLRVSTASGNEKSVEFEGRMSLGACHLILSGAQAELAGTVQAQGSYCMGRGLSAGRVRLAAQRLAIRGKTATNLELEAAYDPNTREWSAQDFLGDCGGGKVLGRLEVGNDDDGKPQYLLQVAFNQVDLEQFLRAGRTGEVAEKRYSSGVMNAALSLAAHVGDGSSRRGVCRVDITSMQVGKVSPLANLLSVLRLSEPTAYTFDRMLIDSYIRHNTLLIRTFDMSGRDVAFTGSGRMDLASEDVDLLLTARGRRVATADPSVLQSLTEGLGGAVVRMEVTGKAGAPHVETKTLPLIGDSLKILGTPQ